MSNEQAHNFAERSLSVICRLHPGDSLQRLPAGLKIASSVETTVVSSRTVVRPLREEEIFPLFVSVNGPHLPLSALPLPVDLPCLFSAQTILSPGTDDQPLRRAPRDAEDGVPR
uniref:Uncharacterized protein n=1 Tax=Chromera velia CCMP2878 TaxID=1169474 RepID=A0A0G4F054_9ALVE|eukprot:Cvel_2580.t1-p1 / transcript=Cvel_2580.t1 / gene=Cvel_2580 / organism=Chromera_velia_CCMP2878 / gene_product=hypothetical protein / transcript_product=hypothetical protein / location=Cvel_scaffold102:55925-57141(+) / protein_length=113 / sequence_SO=supercontig / SO=protein_coding / is_pseudo=false